MAEQTGAGSPYDKPHEQPAEQNVAVTITEPREGVTIETKTFDVKGTAPKGSTVYLMEMTRGFGETEGPGEPLWQYPLKMTAADDNTFAFTELSNGTGMGDNIEHIVYVNVGGKRETPKGLKIVGGTESNKVKFHYKPKEE